MNLEGIREELNLLKNKANKVFDLCTEEGLTLEQTFVTCMIVASGILRRITAVSPLMNTALHGVMSQLRHTPPPKNNEPKH